MKNNSAAVSKAIILFIKYPAEGNVKTRIASSTGNRFAAKFYKLCAEHILSVLDKLRNEIDIFVYFFEQSEKRKIQNWINRDYHYFSQSDGNLGDRMYSAFENVFTLGYSQAAIIGADVPGYSAETLHEVFYHLNQYDAVITPSIDGGYVLLGLKRAVKEVFSDIEWSTTEVFNKTLLNFKKLNYKCKITSELQDIDDEAGLNEWLVKNPGHPITGKIINLMENKER